MPKRVWNWKKLANENGYKDVRTMLNSLSKKLGSWQEVAKYIGVPESSLSHCRRKFLPVEERIKGVTNPTWKMRANAMGFDTCGEMLNHLMETMTLEEVADKFKIQKRTLNRAIRRFAPELLYLTDRKHTWDSLRKKKKSKRICRGCGNEILGKNYFYCDLCHHEKTRLMYEDLEEHHVLVSHHLWEMS